MPIAPLDEKDAPGKPARERVHVALPDWPPHNGRIIQIMPGKKIPVLPDGTECPVVWQESDGIETMAAAHEAFAARKASAKVRTAVKPAPPKP